MSTRPSRTAPTPARVRVVLYSDETTGRGRLRRNMVIASCLIESRLYANVLAIAGAATISPFESSRGIDRLTLPALGRSDDGSYQSLAFDIPLEHLVQIRERTIRATVASFQPDLLIVDESARGAADELVATLDDLRDRSGVHCVLGLRDVLGERASVRARWLDQRTEQAIRDYYDAVWVYGDRSVYDAAEAYGWSDEVASKVCYTGYFDRAATITPAEVAPPFADGRWPERFTLCLAGGGRDGTNLARAFAKVELPPGMDGVVLAGPFLGRTAEDSLRRVTARNPRLHFIGFPADYDGLLQRAERVIAIGGYNTICDLLGYGKSALIVPHVTAGSGQRIRAARLAELGLVTVLEPAAVTVRELTRWLAAEVRTSVQARARIDLGARTRLPELAAELLEHERPPRAVLDA